MNTQNAPAIRDRSGVLQKKLQLPLRFGSHSVRVVRIDRRKNRGQRFAPRRVESLDSQFATKTVFRHDRGKNRTEFRRAQRSLLAQKLETKRMRRTKKRVVLAVSRRFPLFWASRPFRAIGRTGIFHYTDLPRRRPGLRDGRSSKKTSAKGSPGHTLDAPFKTRYIIQKNAFFTSESPCGAPFFFDILTGKPLEKKQRKRRTFHLAAKVLRRLPRPSLETLFNQTLARSGAAIPELFL